MNDREDWKDQLSKLSKEMENGKAEMLIEHIDNIDKEERIAKAPYNFIPLNKSDEVILIRPDEKPGSKKFPLNKYYVDDRKTGYITLTIEPLTPIYIRDTMTVSEVDKEKAAEDLDRKYINSDFFSPTGKFCIPGSTLRGMIRNLVEIVTFGRFGFFEDSRLYFRTLADNSKKMRSEYQKNISFFNRKTEKTRYLVSAGLLSRKGLNYFIQPLGNFKQLTRDEATDELSAIGKEYKQCCSFKIPNKGYLVISGDMDKKNKPWLIKFKKSKSNEEVMELSELDINEYKNDLLRAKDVPNLIENVYENKSIPCFYFHWKDYNNTPRIAFGHTPNFRKAYEKTIGDKIPSYLKKDTEDKKTKPDIAEAIFGNETGFAGRVFFDDAFWINSENKEELEVSIPQILSTPKPTTFQHYLVQRSIDMNELNCYNDNSSIHGTKLYWHKSGIRWKENLITFDKEKFKEFLKESGRTKADFGFDENEPENNKKYEVNYENLTNDLKKIILDSIGIYEKQHTKIQAIEDGTFEGKIRFENLSDVELGALLFVLDLPPGCHHKIGMAKPLGLGSIKIMPQLYISNRKERYKNLWTEWDTKIDESNTIESLKNKFEHYVKDKLKKKVKSLWELDRLKELKIMLNFKHGESLEKQGKTRYMLISDAEGNNEFKTRPVLPKPGKV